MARTERISRKSFLKNFAAIFREISQAANTKGSFVLLPPGVASEKQFLQTCTECYECVSFCPHEALRVCRDPENDFFGKPIIVPSEQPCFMCSDYPCISACQPGALQRAFAQKLNGVARINKNLCLAYSGLFCRACVNACPLANEAISVNAAGRPVVNEEICTGCGICEYQCPAEQPAIEVKPKT